MRIIFVPLNSLHREYYRYILYLLITHVVSTNNIVTLRVCYIWVSQAYIVHIHYIVLSLYSL